MSILKDNQKIGRYTVQSFIKDGQFNESYQVNDSSGVSYFLKIYDPNRVPEKVMNTDSIIAEIGYCEKIRHPNVISYVEKGILPQDRDRAGAGDPVAHRWGGARFPSPAPQKPLLSDLHPRQ